MKNFIEIFDRRFLKIHENSRQLIEQTPDRLLYKQLNKTEADFPFQFNRRKYFAKRGRNRTDVRRNYRAAVGRSV